MRADAPALRDAPAPARRRCRQVPASRRQPTRRAGSPQPVPSRSAPTHVVFGMEMDGRAYPEHPGGPCGALDEVACGPSGLLELLALRLGLTGPVIPPVVRVGTWLAKLDRASNRPRFWSASLGADAWATAAATLAWRDALVEGGWVPGTPAPSRRIADLAAAQEAGPPLPPGRSDLLRAVIDAVRSGAPLDLGRLDLVERIDTLPPGWSDLMVALSDGGVAITALPVRARAVGNTDLERLQRYLAHGTVEPLVGDGSVTVIDARTATMAAEAIAEWLAADENDSGTAIVVPDGDGWLLDQSLTRRAMPMLGLSAPSPRRGPLQVLVLAFATAWRPFDPDALLRLLQLPRAPLPRWVARRLAAALSREGGIGDAWIEAWAGIESEASAHPGGASARAAAALIEGWRAWTDGARFDRDVGIPTAEAIAVCRAVRDWAVAADAGGNDPLLLGCVASADALAAAFDALGRSPLPPTLVESMVAAAIGSGVGDPLHVAQESRVRAVAAPGAVWAEAASLVWWGAPVRPGLGANSPWTRAEATSLAATGCRLDDAAAASGRDADHWRRAASNVTRTLLLVAFPSDRGEASVHPLASLASPLLDGAPVRVDAEDLLARGRVRIGARDVVRHASGVRKRPSALPVWSIPAALSSRIEGRIESATTLQDLLACPFRWLLRRVAGVRPGGDRALPAIDRMVGSLAHAVALASFRSGKVPDPEEVLANAEVAVDALVDRVAAPLRLPGHAASLAFAQARIPASLAALARILAERKATVVGLEVERARRFGDLSVSSRIDMIVREPSGAEDVVDLKWTSSARRRRQEIADGKAVQLATYARLVQPGGGARAGYYLIRQRLLLAGPGTPIASEEVTAARSLDETWDAIEADRSTLVRLAAAEGFVHAAGVPGAEHALPANLGFPFAGSACAYCDFRTICRIPEEHGR